MAGVVTDPRFIARTAVGIDWQTSEGVAVGAPPFTPRQFLVAMNFGRNPDPTYLRPNGTHGSFFERFDGDRIITQAFKKELKLWGGRFQILPFLESVAGGLSTVAFVDLTLSGAQAANITALSFVGVRPHHNTGPFVSTPATSITIYVKIVGGGFPFTVEFYRDAARTLLVATATATAAGVPAAISASGGSELTGSVTLGAGAAAGNADAVVNKVTIAFANQYTRYFRMYYSDGEEVTVLSDCAVSEMAFESAENGELSASIQIMGKRRDFFASTLTVPETQLDLVPYSHSELTLTKDPSGTPVTPVVDSFTFHIRNNVLHYIANSPTPQKIIKRGFSSIGGTFRGEHADETQNAVAQARANTAVAGGFSDLRADYLLAAKLLRFDMKKVRPRLKEPGIASELVEKVEMDYDALYDGVTNPVTISVGL